MKSFYSPYQRHVGALLFGLFLLLQHQTLSAQMLINPAAEGGFQLGPTFADNGWTAATVNSNQTNKWFVGTAPSPTFSSQCAYISDHPSGATWNYDMKKNL